MSRSAGPFWRCRGTFAGARAFAVLVLLAAPIHHSLLHGEHRGGDDAAAFQSLPSDHHAAVADEECPICALRINESLCLQHPITLAGGDRVECITSEAPARAGIIEQLHSASPRAPPA